MKGGSDARRVEQLASQNLQLRDDLRGSWIGNGDCVDKLCRRIREAKNASSDLVRAMEAKVLERVSDLRLKVDRMEESMLESNAKTAEAMKLQQEEIFRVLGVVSAQVGERMDKSCDLVSRHYGTFRDELQISRESLESQNTQSAEMTKMCKQLFTLIGRIQSEMREMKQIQAVQVLRGGKRTRRGEETLTIRDGECQTEAPYKCTLCNFECAAGVPHLLHELGSSHYTKVLEHLVEAAERELDANTNNKGAPSAEEGAKCKICECCFPTMEPWLKHLTSKSHVEKVTADLKQCSGEQFFKTIQENRGKISKRPMVVEAIETALHSLAEAPKHLEEGCSREPEVHPAKRHRSMGEGAPSGDRGQEDSKVIAGQPSNLSLQPAQPSPFVENPRTAVQQGLDNDLAHALESLQQPFDSLLQKLQAGQVSQGTQVQDLIHLLQTRQR